MNYVSPVDWTVIVVYLLGIIALGVWFGKDQRNTRDYFLGNRNLPWWGVGLSIIATETSALTFISVPAIAYGGNIAFIQIITGYVIARVFLAIVMVPLYFKGDVYSPYQLIGDAFGPGARYLVSSLFLVAATLAAGVRVYVTCIPLQLMLNVNVFTAILLFVGLSLVYTCVGGIKAVVWTEFVQFFLFLAGGIFTLWYIPTILDGGFSAAWAEAKAAGKLHWLNAEVVSFKGLLSMPFNIWMGIFGATFLVMASHGADQLIVQRVLTCRSVSDGRKSLILSAVIILPLFLLFLLTGVMLWVFYQHFAIAIPLPETKEGFNKNDYIYPIFILTMAPPVVKGFMIVAILAAAMSSVSAALSALASVSTMDLFRNLSRRERSQDFYLAFSRFSTVGWAVLLVLVAYMSKEVRFVLNWAFSLSGLTSGALLGGLLSVLIWRRGASIPVMAGMAASFAIMLTIHLNFAKDIAWPWYTLIGTTVAISITAITRMAFPEPASTA